MSADKITDIETTALSEKVRLAVCHLAKGILEMHAETAPTYGGNASLAAIALPRDRKLLRDLYDHLAAADALLEQDEWVKKIIREVEAK